MQATFFDAKATSLGLTEVSCRYDLEDPAFGSGEITEVPAASALGAQSVGSLASTFEVKRETLDSKIDVALCSLDVSSVDRDLLGETREGARSEGRVALPRLLNSRLHPSGSLGRWARARCDGLRSSWQPASLWVTTVGGWQASGGAPVAGRWVCLSNRLQ